MQHILLIFTITSVWAEVVAEETTLSNGDCAYLEEEVFQCKDG